MDDLFQKPKHREAPDLNVVPVIDMFTTIIFFLLLSTSFIALTKLTVPPAQVSTVDNPLTSPPLAPKLTATRTPAGGITITLSWMGGHPGQIKEELPPQNSQSISSQTLKTSKDLAFSFKQKFPDEKSLRVGMAEDLSYQILISVMDGVREVIPEIVLISYSEAASSLGTAGAL